MKMPTSNYVFVLDPDRNPVMPCTARRAHELMAKGRAARFRSHPFTIILKHSPAKNTQPLEFKVDPGSKTTGMSLVIHGAKGSRVIIAAHLIHRGHEISESLIQRRAYRRSRRNRHTRYRQKRFDNRRPMAKRDGSRSKEPSLRQQEHYTRRGKVHPYYARCSVRSPYVPKTHRKTRTTKGLATWVPPSTQSRLQQFATWLSVFKRHSPVDNCQVEEVIFDTRLLLHPNTTDYQASTTFGYQMRAYLIHRHSNTCQYCHGASGDLTMTWDHIHPRSQGGTNSSKNATLACYTCNQSKGNLSIPVWISTLHGTSKYVQAIREHAPKVSNSKPKTAKDATVTNVLSRRMASIARNFGYQAGTSPAWVTSMNRKIQGYPKDHWIDAAMVSQPVTLNPNLNPLIIKAKGHGNRRMVRTDSYGFPATNPKGPSTLEGFSTGDLIIYQVPSGKYAGHRGVTTVTSLVHRTKRLRVARSDTGTVSGPATLDIRPSWATKLQSTSGYTYS